eukprot:7473520-Pyramimonas_sp.AAC.1
MFRPRGALAGPRDRQKTTQDEKPVLGSGSGLPGTPSSENLTTSDLWGYDVRTYFIALITRESSERQERSAEKLEGAFTCRALGDTRPA